MVNPSAVLSQVLMEADAQGNILKYYVHGLGLVSSQDGTDYRLYHYNRRGDTVALTNLSGEVTDRMAYDAYGAMVSRTGATATPYLFSGQYGVATDANGLYHMRARYYNPQTMRFISQDTLLGSLADIKSLNRYAYANGNPILYVDPEGHVVFIIPAAIGVYELAAAALAGASVLVTGMLIEEAGDLYYAKSKKSDDEYDKQKKERLKIIKLKINRQEMLPKNII